MVSAHLKKLPEHVPKREETAKSNHSPQDKVVSLFLALNRINQPVHPRHIGNYATHTNRTIH